MTAGTIGCFRCGWRLIKIYAGAKWHWCCPNPECLFCDLRETRKGHA